MYHNACHLVEEKANKSMKPCERTSNSLWSCSALLSLMQYLLPKPRATTAWEPDGIWDGRILSMIGGWAVYIYIYRCRKSMCSAIELFTSTRPCHPSTSSRSFLRFLLIYGGTILPTNQLGPFVQWIPNSYPNRPWLYENRKYETVAVFHLSVIASPGGGRACASSSSGSTSKAHNIDLCSGNGRTMLQFSPYHK